MSAGPHSDTLSERQTRRRNGRFSSTGDSGAQSWTPAPGLGIELDEEAIAFYGMEVA